MTSYLASLQDALHASFARDPHVFLLGEDVVDPYGGAFKVSKGLSTAHPDRVLATPISEAAITGIGAGMAMRGMKPVIEIMFGDFLTLCADQIVNHIAKFPAMYRGRVRVPVVIRTPVGGGRGYGATHSQCLEKMFLGVPEIRVVAPAHVHDPGAQLAHAILDDEAPVLFIEHKLLYPLALFAAHGPLSVEQRDSETGYPTAIVRNHAGREADATVIAYGGLSRLVVPLLAALAEEEIAVTAAFPASLKPLPLDSLAAAAAESGRVVVVEEGSAGFNWGSEVAAALHERLHRQLHAPVRRLASAATAVPACADGERDALVQAEDIENAILEVLE